MNRSAIDLFMRNISMADLFMRNRSMADLFIKNKSLFFEEQRFVLRRIGRRRWPENFRQRRRAAVRGEQKPNQTINPIQTNPKLILVWLKWLKWIGLVSNYKKVWFLVLVWFQLVVNRTDRKTEVYNNIIFIKFIYV